MDCITEVERQTPSGGIVLANSFDMGERPAQTGRRHLAHPEVLGNSGAYSVVELTVSSSSELELAEADARSNRNGVALLKAKLYGRGSGPSPACSSSKCPSGSSDCASCGRSSLAAPGTHPRDHRCGSALEVDVGIAADVHREVRIVR